MISSHLLHYEILGKLGEGGMGVVYKALDKHLDRFVAIKVLSAEHLSDASRKARFIQEAKSASALNHPNIVVVHDVTSDEGTDFIAMEYVSGKTLDHIIPTKGMPVNEALKVAAQISDALACAHAAGIVHRDLKPSNVMVDEHGLVKVLDFGLAKLTEHKEPENASTVIFDAKTEEGAIVGTAAYMSPEQAAGGPVDARSDIFSFGAVLYEMISGHPPFTGDSKMSILASVISSHPKALEHVPLELERLINRCLRKDASRRYQHMDDITVALKELEEESESGDVIPAKPARQHRSPRLLWLAGLGATFAAGAGIWWYTQTIAPVSRHAASVVPLTTYRGDEAFPAFSPDGSQVAFAWSGERGDDPGIYVKSIGADKPLRLTNTAGAEVSPAWSPDGRYIAFLRQLGPLKVACYVVPPTGGTERKVGELSGQISVIFRGLTWLPDSRRLVVGVMASTSWHYSGLQGLRVLSLDSDSQETWTRPDGPRGQDVSPSVSPDGRRLAFARVVDFDLSELHVMDIPAPGETPHAPRRVSVKQLGAADPLWTRDGRGLIYTAGYSGQASFWRAELSKPGDARQIEVAGTDVLQPALSWTANRLAYTRGLLPRPDIWRVALRAPGIATGAAEPLLASTQIDQDPVYSPDGSLIAFESSRSGTAEMWVADKDGRNPLQITSLGTRPNSPVWSPDSRQIAFRCPARGVDEVCVANSLGGAVRRLTRDPAQDRPEAWSPDGKWIYFSSTRAGHPQIWKVPAIGGAAEYVNSEEGLGRLSADAKTRYRVDATTYWITAEPASGGQSEKLFGPVSMMGNWTVARGGIYFIPRSANGHYAVMYYDFHTRATQEVLRLTAAPQWGMSVSPDERYLLFTITENIPSGSDLMLVENFR